MTDDILLAQAKALISDEPNALANTANLMALLFNSLEQVNWAGLYLIREQELVLGPFQGLSACVRIPLGKGVCGSAAAQGKNLRVADVHAFAGHIACDAASRSEIVLPLRHNDVVFGVLDLDSPIENRFSAADETLLRQFADLLENVIAADPHSLGIELA